MIVTKKTETSEKMVEATVQIPNVETLDNPQYFIRE